MERYIAVDNVCAWPNLAKLSDGSIAALLFNQPCHGHWEGDVECWRSTDGGVLWEKAGTVAEHEPLTARVNHAAGLTSDGTLVAVVSGFVKPKRGDERVPRPSETLEPWICRSDDGGKSWRHDVAEIASARHGLGARGLIPFGDIVAAADGSLRMCVYPYNLERVFSAYSLVSRDNGKTWDEPAVIGLEDYNETALLRAEEKTWLAASRTTKDAHLEMFVSEDDCESWRSLGVVTLPNQHPGHLLSLSDRRILLTYGIRNRGLLGVAGRVSADGGRSWGAPFLLVELQGSRDVGYPSSVQVDEGTIVTAYYSSGIPQHQRYYMGVVCWRFDENDEIV